MKWYWKRIKHIHKYKMLPLTEHMFCECVRCGKQFFYFGDQSNCGRK